MTRQTSISTKHSFGARLAHVSVPGHAAEHRAVSQQTLSGSARARCYLLARLSCHKQSAEMLSKWFMHVI